MKDKPRTLKTTLKTKAGVTLTLQKPGWVQVLQEGKQLHAPLVAPVMLLRRQSRCIVIIIISHNWYRNRFVVKTVESYPLSFVKWIFGSSRPHDGNQKISSLMTLIFP